MIELRHMDVRHFVIIECSNLANGCTIKCDCIGLMLFHNLSVVSLEVRSLAVVSRSRQSEK